MVPRGSRQREEAGGEAQWLLSAADYEAIVLAKGASVAEESALCYRATGQLQALGMSLKLYACP